MKNRGIVIIILIAGVIIIGIVFSFFSNTDNKVSRVDDTVTGNEQSDIEEMLASISKEPMALQFRVFLDRYNKGEEKDNIFLETGSELDGVDGYNLSCGISKFTDYLGGRFVVLGIEKNMMGGQFMYILFPNQPNKLFSVWMYPKGDDLWDFRSFCDTKKTSDEIKTGVIEPYGRYFERDNLPI